VMLAITLLMFYRRMTLFSLRRLLGVRPAMQAGGIEVNP